MAPCLACPSKSYELHPYNVFKIFEILELLIYFLQQNNDECQIYLTINSATKLEVTKVILYSSVNNFL